MCIYTEECENCVYMCWGYMIQLFLRIWVEIKCILLTHDNFGFVSELMCILYDLVELFLCLMHADWFVDSISFFIGNEVARGIQSEFLWRLRDISRCE